MKSRFLLLTLVIALFSAGFLLSEESTSARVEGLAASLPDSDGVVVIDAKRLVDSALPSMLASNPLLLMKIDGEVEKFRQNSGLDLRSFDQVAISMKYREGGKSDEVDFVILARSNASTPDLEKVAKVASKGDFTKKKVGSRNVYFFSGDKFLKDKKPENLENSFFGGMANKFLAGLSGDMAMSSYDSNTIVLGNKGRVLDTIGNGKRISSELLAMVSKNEGGLAAVSMNTPSGLSQFVTLDEDELGKSLDAIRSVHGKFDLVDGSTKISATAVSMATETAEELSGMLGAMAEFGASILKGNKGADKQVYGRILENVVVEQIENSINVLVSVSQEDMDVIIKSI